MNKLDELIQWFENKNKVIVALSGGVDSALVAFAAHEKLGDSAIAVTADYKTLSNEELETSKRVCSEIGIRQIIINYSELDNKDFIRNDNNRCFYCRSELATHLLSLAKENHISTIVDGTNLDDLDDYRPGFTALKENNILNPLITTGFTKKEVRYFAKKANLSVYDKPSNSCLASRIPWGQSVTSEKLAQIEMAETFVKQITNVRQIRVRHIDGIAQIEVEKDQIHLLSNNIDEINKKLLMIGFSSIVIDTEGYKTGKLNVIVD